MPQVPLLDLRAQFAPIAEEVHEAIREVCATQHFILGERVRRLEEETAAYSHCRYGVGVSSGTDALLLAFMALDIGPGDVVVTTPFTFFATGGTVARLGARPLFCDIDPVSFNLTAETVAAALERECEVRQGGLVHRQTGGAVKALVPVHLFGQLAEMEPLLELARRHGLFVVEDAAQAIGSEDAAGRRAGSFGDIGCFSFFPTKNLGAFGDAGLCTTDDAELAERMRVLRVHGGKPKYHHAVIGGNFRLDELQAAVLLVKLPHLDGWTAARQRNAAEYTAALVEAGLGDRLVPPAVQPGYRHIFNQYVPRCDRRDELRAALTAAGVGTEIYYPISLHMQECFAYLGYRPEDLPEARRAAAEVLALPVYPELTGEQRRHVVEAIAAFFARQGAAATASA